MMKTYAIISGFALLIVSCQYKSTSSPDPRAIPDGMPTTKQFEKGIQKYPYTASAIRAAKIRTGLNKIERYMTKQQVLELLGRPDYSRINYGPKGPGEKWLGSSWTYWLTKRDSGANSYDPCVQIFFNKDGLADWIAPSNIIGASEIGGPKQRNVPNKNGDQNLIP